MGALAYMIVFVIIAIIGIEYSSQIRDEINAITNNALISSATATTNAALKIQAIKSGQQLCSLKVVFNPQLQAPFGGLSTVSAIIPNGAQSINWYSCHNPTPSLAMLIPVPNPTFVNTLMGSPTPLDFLNGNVSPAPYLFSAPLIADDGTQAQPIVNPIPAIGLNSQNPAYGQSFTITAIYQDIPRQHYVVALSSSSIAINQGINTGNTGSIYYQQINP